MKNNKIIKSLSNQFCVYCTINSITFFIELNRQNRLKVARFFGNKEFIGAKRRNILNLNYFVAVMTHKSTND